MNQQLSTHTYVPVSMFCVPGGSGKFYAPILYYFITQSVAHIRSFVTLLQHLSANLSFFLFSACELVHTYI